MAFIDSEVIHRWEEEQALKALEFEPATVDVIEITLFAVPFPTLRAFYVSTISLLFQDQPPSILRLSLQPAELEAWIEKVASVAQARLPG